MNGVLLAENTGDLTPEIEKMATLVYRIDGKLLIIFIDKVHYLNDS